jgi:hypothetical protein
LHNPITGVKCKLGTFHIDKKRKFVTYGTPGGGGDQSGAGEHFLKFNLVGWNTLNNLKTTQSTLVIRPDAKV